VSLWRVWCQRISFHVGGIAAVSVAECSAAGVDAPATTTNTTTGGGTTTRPHRLRPTGVNDAKVKVLATQLSFPYNVITDGTNVYWIDAETGSVGSVSTSSGQRVVYRGGGVGAGFDIAQDATNLYFCLNNSRSGNCENRGTVSVLIAAGRISTVAVVIANGKVYFGNGGSRLVRGRVELSPVTFTPV